MRLKHYSIQTEECYCDWIKRYIRFHGDLHPRAATGRRRDEKSIGLPLVFDRIFDIALMTELKTA
jgi:hypothetical protein